MHAWTEPLLSVSDDLEAELHAVTRHHAPGLDHIYEDVELDPAG